VKLTVADVPSRYTDHVHCKTCNYPLTNLAERRCPECGRAFDPADPRTWALSDDAGRRFRRLSWAVLVAIIVLALFLIAAAIPLFQNYPIF
jgi:hypothetical protein